MNLNTEEIKQAVVNNVQTTYDAEQAKLVNIGKTHKTEGEIRYAAGELVEKVLQSIFDAINSFLGKDKIISKVGSADYLKKEIDYQGQSYFNNYIQVDRHVWYKGRRIAFIENKTYLDTCYYDRALADFKKIVQALKQQAIDPTTCKFIVFAGQKAGRDNTFLTYEAEFWHETKTIIGDTGIAPKTIYFLKGIRSSSRPLYKVKHELNFDAIKKFVDIILAQLN